MRWRRSTRPTSWRRWPAAETVVAKVATIRQALARARRVLSAHSPTPGLDAEVLLMHVGGFDTVTLMARDEQPLDAATLLAFEQRVQRRARGEPVAYLTGRREFWSLSFAVRPSTLIPRPDTETLVALALDGLDGEADILDLGTGSGNIAVALALACPRCRVTAVDIEADAVALARENAARLGARVDVRQGDWFAALDPGMRFDLVVSNPPYVAEGDHHLDEGDVAHEPRSALVAGVDGLDDIRRIVHHAQDWLRPGGGLLLEHGAEQAAAVRALLAERFQDVASRRDLAGHERVSFGRKPSS